MDTKEATLEMVGGKGRSLARMTNDGFDVPGGILGHGSIVAREFGIPAVVGTGISTEQIKHGQQITVDGDAGTVTILKDAL
jgi:phosphoenolpyruvate synthase/pyruvate phosphate dikinase